MMKKMTTAVLLLSLLLSTTAFARDVNLVEFLEYYAQRLGETNTTFNPAYVYAIVDDENYYMVSCKAGSLLVSKDDLVVETAKTTLYDYDLDIEKNKDVFQSTASVVSVLEYDVLEDMKFKASKSSAMNEATLICANEIFENVNELIDDLKDGKSIECYKGNFAYSVSYNRDENSLSLTATKQGA